LQTYQALKDKKNSTKLNTQRGTDTTEPRPSHPISCQNTARTHDTKIGIPNLNLNMINFHKNSDANPQVFPQINSNSKRYDLPVQKAGINDKN
jgi:hypothetical protein